MTILRARVDHLRYRWRMHGYHPRRREQQADIRRMAARAFQTNGLDRVLASSISCGADLGDYYLLMHYVFARWPGRGVNILEFGSGATTLLIDWALEVCRGGSCRSYEHLDVLADHTRARLTGDAVALRSAARVEGTWRGLRGVWYAGSRETPPVDLIFVDGPPEYAADGSKGVCLDVLLWLERHPDARVDVLIDRKFNSLEAYQSVLPAGRVFYDPVWDVGFIAQVSGRELLKAPRPSPVTWTPIGNSMFTAAVWTAIIHPPGIRERRRTA